MLINCFINSEYTNPLGEIFSFFLLTFNTTADGASIVDYGFYPLAVIYNPNHYDKAKEKVFDDHGKLSPIASNMLDNFLNNKNNLTTQDVLQNVFSQLQKEADEEAERLAREREEERQREEELNEKNEELKELIEKDEIKIFKVVKGNDIGSGRSAVVLQFTAEGKGTNEVILDSNKYYIAEYEDNEYLHCVSSGYDMLVDHENLFFVLNKSSYSGFESGFYSADSTDPHNYAKYSKEPYLSGDQLSEKLSNELEEDSNQIGTEFTIDDEQVDEEVVVESEIKSRRKKVAEENDNSTEESDNSVNTQARKEDQTMKPQVSQELMQNLFPNTENVTINNNLTIEVKYGEGMEKGYTYDYMKDALKEVYEDWCDNFYTQKSNNGGPAKIQLYIFKNDDDYEKYIEELSGEKFWRGGTVREHEPDGTIAKTFILGGSLPCSKSLYLMEQMSDAFLEYATGNLDAVPQALRSGMGGFMWNYGFAKQGKNDMYYMKDALNEMRKLGCTTPYDIINVSKSLYAPGCLVRFLQDKYPSLINDLIRNNSKYAIKAELEKRLKNPEIEREFKKWILEQSGEKIIEDLVPNNDSMLLENYKIKVDIKYDGKNLSNEKLESIKSTIQNSIEDYDSTFNVNAPWYDRNLSVFIFNTEEDYQDYLKASKGSSSYMKSSGMTTIERHNFHVHLYIQNNFEDSCKTLKHEMGHALNIMNSYYGTGVDVPLSMHEGIANYVADLENGKHINDHGDKEALIAIRNKDLKPDEILRNNIQSNRGEHYHSDAEQVIKFLEDKHPDMIDNLLKNLSTRGTDRSQGSKLVEDFLTKLKGYDQEFKQWVEVELSSEKHSQHKYVKVNQPDYGSEAEKAQNEQESSHLPANQEKTSQSAGEGLSGLYTSMQHASNDKTNVEEKTPRSNVSKEDGMQLANEKRSKRALEEDKNEQEEVVMKSVINSMKDNTQENLKHPLKIKIGEPIETGKYKAVLQATGEDIDNFYQNLNSQYTARKYDYDQMITLYKKVYARDSSYDEKLMILPDAYVTNNHLFIKNYDFGTLSDFNEMFYKSDELI